MANIREIVLDTETTGLDPLQGHRIVEIGCLELINHIPTGAYFQTYLCPDRAIDKRASEITGITDEQLIDKPRFGQVVKDFLEFISDSTLIIHNAPFDMRFLNAELTRLKMRNLSMERVIDTLVMTKQKFPGSPASLDALCKRFEIDLKERAYHGALLDAQLLAKVYLELIGGRQPDLEIMEIQSFEKIQIFMAGQQRKQIRPAREFPINLEELKNHKEFIKSLKNPLWLSLDEYLKDYEENLSDAA